MGMGNLTLMSLRIFWWREKSDDQILGGPTIDVVRDETHSLASLCKAHGLQLLVLVRRDKRDKKM